MANMNRVFLVGNLTRDPETKTMPSGSTVADMRLAVNEYYKTPDGKNKEKTCFVDIVAWNRQAELCGEYLKKGSMVLIEGRLQYEEWNDKEGNKKSRLRIRADRVQFLSRNTVGRGETGDDTRSGDSDTTQAQT